MKKLFLVAAAFALTLGLGAAGYAANAQGIFKPNPVQATATKGIEREPAAVVKAYYTALNARNIEGAIELLPDDVVFRTNEPNGSGGIKRVEYIGIEAVQNFIAGDQTVFSRNIQHLRVNGDTVEYTLTEWLNPRIVGNNVTQPAVSHWLARVQHGKILTMTEDSSSF